jgi:pimeloyl-ACP methyl ester carboxylesterase
MVESYVEISRRVGGVLQGTHFQSGGKPKSTNMVIMCHGFTGDKHEGGRFQIAARALNDGGFDALIFDFSGSGDNPRETITLTKQVQDLEDVYNWVKRLGYAKMGTIGLSFGGTTSLLAELPERKVAVFWAPAFYPSRIITPLQGFLIRIHAFLKRSPLKRKSSDNEPVLIDHTFMDSINKVNCEVALRNFHTPALIVQGTEDKVVKPTHSREAISIMPQDEDHKLIEVEGASHCFYGEHLDLFIKHSIDWLRRYLT